MSVRSSGGSSVFEWNELARGAGRRGGGWRAFVPSDEFLLPLIWSGISPRLARNWVTQSHIWCAFQTPAVRKKHGSRKRAEREREREYFFHPALGIFFLPACTPLHTHTICVLRFLLLFLLFGHLGWWKSLDRDWEVYVRYSSFVNEAEIRQPKWWGRNQELDGAVGNSGRSLKNAYATGGVCTSAVRYKQKRESERPDRRRPRSSSLAVS